MNNNIFKKNYSCSNNKTGGCSCLTCKLSAGSDSQGITTGAGTFPGETNNPRIQSLQGVVNNNMLLYNIKENMTDKRSFASSMFDNLDNKTSENTNGQNSIYKKYDVVIQDDDDNYMQYQNTQPTQQQQQSVQYNPLTSTQVHPADTTMNGVYNNSNRNLNAYTCVFPVINNKKMGAYCYQGSANKNNMKDHLKKGLQDGTACYIGNMDEKVSNFYEQLGFTTCIADMDYKKYEKKTQIEEKQQTDGDTEFYSRVLEEMEKDAKNRKEYVQNRLQPQDNNVPQDDTTPQDNNVPQDDTTPQDNNVPQDNTTPQDNNKILVTVGQGGTSTIKWSTDKNNWNNSNNSFTSIGWCVESSNNNLLLAGGQGGSAIKSSNDGGKNWSDIKTDFTDCFGLCYGNNIWVAVGKGGSSTIKWSSNGIDWTNAINESNENNQCFNTNGYSVHYSNGKFVAVGNDQDMIYENRHIIQYSTDGKNWMNSSPNFEISGRGIYYGGNKWVAVGQGGTSTIKYSNDGINWNNAKNGFEYTGLSVSYNNGLWIATGRDKRKVVGNNVKYSTDGINWNNALNNLTTSARGITWGDKIYVVGEGNSLIQTSDNGQEFKNIDGLKNFFRVACNGIKIVNNVQENFEQQTYNDTSSMMCFNEKYPYYQDVQYMPGQYCFATSDVQNNIKTKNFCYIKKTVPQSLVNFYESLGIEPCYTPDVPDNIGDCPQGYYQCINKNSDKYKQCVLGKNYHQECLGNNPYPPPQPYPPKPSKSVTKVPINIKLSCNNNGGGSNGLVDDYGYGGGYSDMYKGCFKQNCSCGQSPCRCNTNPLRTWYNDSGFDSNNVYRRRIRWNANKRLQQVQNNDPKPYDEYGL